jgi:hypothetical protein
MNRQTLAVSCLALGGGILCLCSLLVIVLWVPLGYGSLERTSALEAGPYWAFFLVFLGLSFVVIVTSGIVWGRQVLPEIMFLLRHGYAALGTLVAFTGVALLAILLVGGLSGVGFLLVYSGLFPRVIGLVILVFMPLCAILEHSLIGKLRWRWWRHVPLVIAICGLLGVVIGLLLPLLQPSTGAVETWASRARLAGQTGILVALLGATYWLVLRTSQGLLENAFRPEEAEEQRRSSGDETG